MSMQQNLVQFITSVNKQDFSVQQSCPPVLEYLSHSLSDSFRHQHHPTTHTSQLADATAADPHSLATLELPTLQPQPANNSSHLQLL
ncbi:hypothetical protein PSHT_15837 [Puccinia striiformis]|uniref:Uncharacterized protein n=1 Tax=Puccinia striiformis TaxID=27350 RepID=A0A2S4UD87_9BASI|nr:hypothetical protein PSHT_15837 [Puccinia striiformis]